MDSPIEFGFGVSLVVSAEESVYLASPGFADPRLVMRRRDRNVPMPQFDRCVFRFEAPPQLQKRSIPHDLRSKSQLTYGKAVCLVHQYSGLYVTIVKKPAESNPQHFKIQLMTLEDAGSACKFRIMPRYKIRSEGDKVCDIDMIYLQQENSSTALCTAPQKGIDEPEVTAWEIPSTLQVCLYDGASKNLLADDRHPQIRAGMATLIFHREQDAFLTIPTVPQPQQQQSSNSNTKTSLSVELPKSGGKREVPFFKRFEKLTTALSAESFDYSCNAMWIIENTDPTIGGSIRAAQPFRIRHGATGKYLVARKAAKSSAANQATTPEVGLEEIDAPDVVELSVWEVDCVSAPDTTGNVYSSKSFLQIRHRPTSSFLSTLKASSEVSLVALTPHSNLEDTLSLVMVPRDRQQELSYLIGNVEFLKSYIKLFYKLQEPSCHLSPRDPIVSRVVQRATSSLGALIRFCTESEDQDPLTREGLPISHHQQSMFEVQLHSTAMDVLLCPFVSAHKDNKLELPLQGGVLTMEEILEPTYANIHTVCRLCYRLLKQMSKASPFAGLLVEYVDFMKAQEGYKLHVADTQMEIFTDNPNIPQGVCEDNIHHFVKLLLTKGRSSGYLRFLSSLCVVGDVGVLHNQKLVCDLVLRQHADRVLYKTAVMNGVLCIQVPKVAKGSKKKAVVEDEDGGGAAAWEELSHFLRSGESKSVKFFETSIDLLGVLVLGGNEECLAVVREVVPIEHLTLCIDPDFPASESLRASLFSLALHLYMREILDRMDRPDAMIRYTCGSLVHAGATAEFFHSPSQKKNQSGKAIAGSEAFFNCIKDKALHYLQQGKLAAQRTVGMNELLLTATGVWHSVVSYDQYTHDDISRVVRAVVETLEGGIDAKGDERYILSEDTAIVMKTKRGLCMFLHVVLRHELTRISDAIMHELAVNGKDAALKNAEEHIHDLRHKIFDEGRLFPILLDLMFYENKDLVSVAVELALALCNSGGVVAHRVSVAEPVRSPLATKVFKLFVRVSLDLSKNLSPSGNVLNEESLVRAIREISNFDPTNLGHDMSDAPKAAVPGGRRMSMISKMQTKVNSMISLNRTLGSIREQRGQWRKSEESVVEYARLLFHSGLHQTLLQSLKLTESDELRLALLEFFRVLCASSECAATLCREIDTFVPYVQKEETRSEAAAIILRLVQHSPSLAEALDEEVVSQFVNLLLTLQEPVIAEGLEHVVLGTFPVARHQELVLTQLLTRDVVQNLLAMNSDWPLTQLSFNSACVDLMACCCVGNSSCKAIMAKNVKSDDLLRILSQAAESGHLVPYFKLLCSGYLSIEEFLTAQELQMIKRHWAECPAWWSLMEGMVQHQLSSSAKNVNEDVAFHGILPVLQAYYKNLYTPQTAKSKLGIPASSMAKLLTSFAQAQLASNSDMSEYIAVTLVHTLSAIGPHAQNSECHAELIETITSLQKVLSKMHDDVQHVQKRERLPGSDSFSTRWGENTAEALGPLMNLISYGGKIHVELNPRARRLHEKLVRHIEARELSEAASVGIMASLRFSVLQFEGSDCAAEFTAAQNYLNSIGSLRMVTETAISSSEECGAETMLLAIAILEGGNLAVQNSILQFFSSTDERFFHEISDMIRGKTEASQHHRTRGTHATFYSGVKESQLSFGNMCHNLRFLQLLCEGHHLGLQDYLREQQDNLRSVNVVKDIERFAAELALHDLTHESIELMEQTLAVLTEFCQGPCRGNQKLLVSSGICHVINSIFASQTFATPQPFSAQQKPLLQVKHRAMIMLNALLEGTADKSLVTIVTQDLPVTTLGKVLDEFALTDEFKNESNEDVCEIVYSCLIAVKTLMNTGAYEGEDKIAVDAILVAHADRFASLGQIEIERDDVIEPVYFRVPKICSVLSEESKETLKWSLDRSTQGSKLSDFLDKCDEMIFDMEAMHRVTQQMKDNKVFMILARWPLRKWDDCSLLFAMIMNLLFVAVIEDCHGLMDKHVDWLGVEGLIRLCAYTQVILTSIIAFMDSSFNFPLILYKQSKAIKSPTALQKMSAIMQRNETLYRFAAVAFAIMGFMFYDFFFAFHLLGLIARSSELKNVIVAVTQNGKTLLLTGMLGCVVVYLFSIIGFVVFHDHFEHSCDTLSQCVVHILTTGLRQGGGIGDQMTTIKYGEPMYLARTIFDFLFWAIMIVIFLNILFGIIIDTFAELRDDKNKKEEDMRTRCTICGIDSYTFDRYGGGFRQHTKEEHSMWTYLYFLHHLKKKEPTEYNGQESHVAECVASGDISFFPAGKCSSLKDLPTNPSTDEGDEDGGSDPRRPPLGSDEARSTAGGAGASVPKAIEDAQQLLASSFSAQSDQTITLLQKIWTRLDSAGGPDALPGPRITPQTSFRRLQENDGVKSAEVIRLEHANQALNRQVYEMERTHSEELERAKAVHQLTMHTIVGGLGECAERYAAHLALLETIEGLYARSKSELFFNALSALFHAIVQSASAYSPRSVLDQHPTTHIAGDQRDAVISDDPLMRDGQEVMKLLRMTIREARAAISTKPSEFSIDEGDENQKKKKK